MNVLVKVIIGASISLLTTMGFAAIGKEVSTYKIDGGTSGSGVGFGKGYWGIATSDGEYQDNSESLAAGKGQTDIVIYDVNTQKTPLTHVKSKIAVNLHKDAATNVWSGKLSVMECTNLGGKVDGCDHVKIEKPVKLYDIKVNMDSENSGTVSFKENVYTFGITAVETASYKLTNGFWE